MSACKYIFNIFLFGLLTLPLTSFYTVPARISGRLPVAKPIAKPFFFGSPHASSEKRMYGPGEYFNVFVDRPSGRAYEFMGVPRLLSTLHVWKVAGGAHNYMLLDSAGIVYVAGNDNTYGQYGNGTNSTSSQPQPWTVDSSGNALPTFVAIMSGGTTGWTSAALGSDGNIYACGALTMGTRGNGTYGGNTNRPVKISLPGGALVKQLIFNELCIALTTTGDVYTWGASGVGGGFWTPFILAQGNSTGNSLTPTKISLPLPAVMIAGGNEMMNYAVLNNGRVRGWGFNLQYVGISGKDMSNYGYNAPDVTDSLGITPGTLDTIAASGLASYMLKTDSTAYGWGSNACSNLGFRGIDYSTYSPVWAFNQSLNPMQAPVLKPIRLAPGIHNITNIYVSLAYCYAVGLNIHATNGNDSVIWCGRNKYQVTNAFQAEKDSVDESGGSIYPDNFDLEHGFVLVDPFRTTYIVRAVPRYCAINPSGTLCTTTPNQWDGTKAPPVSHVGADQTISGSVATVYGFTTVAAGVSGVLNTSWSCISKPSGAADPVFHLNTSDTTKVYGLVTGIYVMKRWTEDANFKTDSATVTINVSSTPPPTNPSNYLKKRRGSRRVWAAIKHDHEKTSSAVLSLSPAALRAGKYGYSIGI